MAVSIKYGVPWRQISLVLALGVLLFAGSVTIAVMSPWFLLAAALLVLQFFLLIKVLRRHISAVGEASLTGDALEIEPRRRAVGASGKPIRVPWGELVSAGVGTPLYGKTPFMMLTTSSHPRRFGITVLPDGNQDFFHDLLERADTWRRAHPALPPLRREDPWSGPWWRGLGWLGIAGFAALIFGIFYSGQASDWSSWLRLLWLGCLLFPLLNRVFRPPGPIIDEPAVPNSPSLALQSGNRSGNDSEKDQPL